MLYKKIWLSLLLVCIFIHVNAQVDNIKLKSGDLLFQNLDCGPLCDAIEKVTMGFDNKDFSHIGLVYIKSDTAYIIEAIGNSVHLTPLHDFLARSHNKIYVGRLKPQYQKLNQVAIKYALAQLDKPYDDEFLYDNGKYYCSELVYDAYMHANRNQPFFKLEPMTFKQPGSDNYFEVWREYYTKLAIPIPEGKPGINPGGISRSEKIDILNRK